MPRKSAIQKKKNEVYMQLARRDTNGIIKCSFKTCDKTQNLILHHRYELFLSCGDQYGRIQSCEENLDNCELLCKYHANIMDKSLQHLEDLRLSGDVVLCQDKKKVRDLIVEKRKELEEREAWEKEVWRKEKEDDEPYVNEEN